MKKNIKRIHFLGIGGISQSALAIILKKQGYFISGSDRAESETTKQLKEQGIPVCINGESEFIESCDLVVVSAAIKENDIELKRAKRFQKEIISRAEMLGHLAKEYKNVISIAGSHGKTTTTGMVASVFIVAGLNPTVHIGGNMDLLNGNVRVGGKEFFITEACEYVDSFLSLKSDVSVILNVQKDHMDYFKTFDNVKKSFKKFANNTKKGGLIIYSADDKNAFQKYREASIGYSVNGAGVVLARNIKEYEKGKYKFTCYLMGKRLFSIKLNVYGAHNVSNALACICVALKYGINPQFIKTGLEKFRGIKRRFEDYGYINGVKIIHDYAHHPTEIQATIDIAKRLSKGSVHVVFQPHTYSRTKLLYKEFLECFNGAKEVCIYKVYSARETPNMGINENELARGLSLNGLAAFSFDNYEEMQRYIFSKTRIGDILLILGAGDIESFALFVKS